MFARGGAVRMAWGGGSRCGGAVVSAAAAAARSIFTRSLEHAKMFLGVGLRMDRNPEKLDDLRRCAQLLRRAGCGGGVVRVCAWRRGGDPLVREGAWWI